jgi:hypothetical protein
VSQGVTDIYFSASDVIKVRAFPRVTVGFYGWPLFDLDRQTRAVTLVDTGYGTLNRTPILSTQSIHQKTFPAG